VDRRGVLTVNASRFPLPEQRPGVHLARSRSPGARRRSQPRRDRGGEPDRRRRNPLSLDLPEGERRFRRDLARQPIGSGARARRRRRRPRCGAGHRCIRGAIPENEGRDSQPSISLSIR
jgi:hypothetical protein